MAKLKEIYPDKCLKIEQELNLSAELEKMNTDDIDAIAGASGHMLGTIFSYKDDEWSKSLYETSVIVEHSLSVSLPDISALNVLILKSFSV